MAEIGRKGGREVGDTACGRVGVSAKVDGVDAVDAKAERRDVH